MKKTDKNSLTKFVDRIFNFKKNASIKKYLLISSVFGLTISTALSISLPLILNKSKTNWSNQNKSNYYKFDNNFFSSKEEIYNYIKEFSIESNHSFENSKYVLDDKIFDYKTDLDKYIDQKFKIEKMHTKRNPNDYLISSYGELSGLVNTSSNEKNITVYKGINGSAYLTENQAKKTYENNYSEKYIIEGQLFDNLYSAREYYIDVKLKKLEESSKKEICYENAGMCQTKEQITSWIRNNTIEGFEYKGKEFSNFNYSEFLAAMENLDQSIIDENIVPVRNADKSSYWVEQNTNNFFDYFVGPRYFESNEKVATSTEFVSTNSNNLDLMGTIISLGSFGTIFVKTLYSSEKVNAFEKNYEMADYLENTFKNLNLNQNILKNFNTIFEDIKSQTIRNSLSEGLDVINDSDLTNFHRMLISFKRFLDISKIYDIDEIKSDELEKILKDIVLEILSTQKGFLDTVMGDEWRKIFEDENIPFQDLHDIFLNPSNFNSDGGFNKKVWDISQKIMDWMSGIMDIAAESIDSKKDVENLKNDFEKMKTQKFSNSDEFEKALETNYSKANSLVIKNEKQIIATSNLDFGESKTMVAPLVVLGVIAKIWSFSKLISFISLETYESKLDSNNSLLYFRPEIGLFLGKVRISLAGKPPNQKIHQLSNSALSYYAPSSNGIELNELYEFNGKYYKEKHLAIEDLKREIYKTPEKYLETKKIFTSVLSKSEFQNVNIGKVSENDDITDGYITRYEYNRELANKKQEYVERLFTKYYENTKKEFYLDGFGGYHETRELAKQSLRSKADKISNYKKTYVYNFQYHEVQKETEEEIVKFIRENQPIQSKQIINTDLIESSYYDNLKENLDYNFSIYKIKYYGQIKYFRSYLEAKKFLERNVKFEYYVYNKHDKTYEFKNFEFYNFEDLKTWADKNTEVITENEYLENTEVFNYDKISLNAFYYN